MQVAKRGAAAMSQNAAADKAALLFPGWLHRPLPWMRHRRSCAVNGRGLGVAQGLSAPGISPLLARLVKSGGL